MTPQSVDIQNFIRFKSSIRDIPLPERFTFPFYYEPHPIALLAAKEAQKHLIQQADWNHNFGIGSEQEGMSIGKMFGILVVQAVDGSLGYLAAFSGKIADENHHKGFVPPVFDMLTEGSFFNVGMEGIIELTAEIDALEANPELKAAKALLKSENEQYKIELEAQKEAIRQGRKVRKIEREASKERNSAAAHALFLEEKAKESLAMQTKLHQLKYYWNERLAGLRLNVEHKTKYLQSLRKKRKETSAALQQRLFDNYTFLNKDKKSKSLTDIFQQTTPPAGAGECAAPKLLQYAFLYNLKPIALAEFWWGQPPKSEVRKHLAFYPACRGKCEPILAHMLSGMDMDPNPLLENTALGRKVEMVFEDESFAIILKPTEFLSVPGKSVSDSVAERMKIRYPEATGPLVVHRLDMSTSGLMLIAKSEEMHKVLQKQFMKRTIKKRYVAVLDGIVEGEEGTIDLPLRVDLDDRPRQLVCYEYGKSSRTLWKVVARKNGRTLIHFFPITGRTHQLRVHAAHPLGLNVPIVGDDLYGKKADRLHLHAEYLAFAHPVSKEPLEFEVAADWSF